MKIKLFLTSSIIAIGLTLNAQWIQTNFPNGISMIRCIAVNGDNIFAGTISNGAFLSTNSGTSWNAINNGLTSTWVEALAISGNSIFASNYVYGVFLSTNNGASWSPTSLSIGTDTYQFAINGSNIFAGGLNGIFSSTNNGTTWTNVFPSHNVMLLVSNGSSLIAGTDSCKVFISTNNGSSWSQVNNGLPIAPYSLRSLAISGSSIFASIMGFGIYVTTNNGASWTLINNGLPFPLSGPLLATSGSKIFAGTGNGTVSLSTNNGQNWTTVNTGLPVNGIFSSLTVSGSYIYAGIFISDNNNSVWKRPLSEFVTQIPDAVTLDASSIQLNGATLNASVNPHNLPTTVDFEYGPSISYGNIITVTTSPLNGSANINVNYLLTSLNSNTTYHYRVKATNSLGVSYGNDIQFKTNSSGLDSIDNLIQFLLFPNPVQDKIIIEIVTSTPHQHFSGIIYDIKGQLLIQQQISGSSAEINISSLAAGMYFLKIENQEGIGVKIFIKE